MNKKILGKVVTFKVKERIESDHAPISVVISQEHSDKESRAKQESEGRKENRQVISQDDESIEIFKAQTDEKMEDIKEEDTNEERWSKIKT